jgi:hypothetical protein
MGCVVIFLILAFLADLWATIHVFSGGFGFWERVGCVLVLLFLLSAISGLLRGVR